MLIYKIRVYLVYISKCLNLKRILIIESTIEFHQDAIKDIFCQLMVYLIDNLVNEEVIILHNRLPIFLIRNKLLYII